MDGSITIVLDSRELLSGVCGVNDGNLRILEGSLGGHITVRGNEIRFQGAGEADVRRFKMMIDHLAAAVRNGENPAPDYVQALAGLHDGGAGEASGAAPPAPDPMRESLVQIPRGFRTVFPKSRNQAAYIQAMRNADICFAVGPAGTGKTFLAVAEALRLVLGRSLRRLVLTRPVVEAGESLGFLPGDLSQKISPWLRPLYDAMETLIPYETVRHMEEGHVIEIVPLAYMRGRSLNNAMIILDEAQNTTKEQMKMFLTRIGEGARAVITGDVTQIDLPRRGDSGLLHALSILKDLDGIRISWLHTVDVVRHPVVRKIIEAYERAENPGTDGKEA